ncbi:ATP-dependent DNA helicase [Senna tora]|uniref:ATP-dependent DNA helicase n=1 Tax=Senna tora TaxID=362788 RepID=A0A834TJR2_9FABA|nr:ATP-dependent DNA helicase [Senna tora]
MVQLMKSEKLLSDLETASCSDKVPVKLEIEDSLEDEHGPLNKRLRPSSAPLEDSRIALVSDYGRREKKKTQKKKKMRFSFITASRWFPSWGAKTPW